MAHFIGAAAFGSQINVEGGLGEGCVYYDGYTCDGANRRGYRVPVYTEGPISQGSRQRACACNN
jgi:hypothetical protein